MMIREELRLVRFSRDFGFGLITKQIIYVDYIIWCGRKIKWEVT